MSVSRLQTVLFFLYVFFWTSQGLLIHSLKSSSGPAISSFELVLVQELVKLFFSASQSISRDHPSLLVRAMGSRRGLLFAVPALLYAAYNNLTYVGLQEFSPSTYFVLMQFRIVVTGFVSVWILGRQFTRTQWTGLAVITIGAMLKEWGLLAEWLRNPVTRGSGYGYCVIFFQIFLSTSAGVFTEKLLKSSDIVLSTHSQNLMLYLHSVLINGMLGWWTGGDRGLQPFAWVTRSGLAWAVVLNGAAVGIVTGFFLRHLDSVAKSIASAIELWATLIASHLVFGYPIDYADFAGLAVLSVGVWLYSAAEKQNKTESKKHN